MILVTITKKYCHRRVTVKRQVGYRSFKCLWFFIAWMSQERAHEMLIGELDPLVVLMDEEG